MPLLWVNAKSSNINKGTRKFILAPELQFLNCLQEIVFSLDSISIDNNRDDDVEDWKHLSFFPLRHLQMHNPFKSLPFVFEFRPYLPILICKYFKLGWDASFYSITLLLRCIVCLIVFPPPTYPPPHCCCCCCCCCSFFLFFIWHKAVKEEEEEILHPRQHFLFAEKSKGSSSSRAQTINKKWFKKVSM